MSNVSFVSLLIGYNGTGCGWSSAGNISVTTSSTTKPNFIASSLISSKSSFQTKIVPSTITPQATTKTIRSTTTKTGISTASMSISPTSTLIKTTSNVMHSMPVLNLSKTSSGNQSTTLVALASSPSTSASTTHSTNPPTTLGGWAGRWCWVASSAGAPCYFCI